MQHGRMALIFFFGVFWCSVLAAAARYRPFDTTAFYTEGSFGHAARRFLFSFLSLNVLPVGLLFLLYHLVVPDRSDAVSVIAAATGALGVFGCHRMLHAIIASKKWHSWFYADETWREVLSECTGTGANSFQAHFCPSIFYLLFFPAIALCIGESANILRMFPR